MQQECPLGKHTIYYTHFCHWSRILLHSGINLHESVSAPILSDYRLNMIQWVFLCNTTQWDFPYPNLFSSHNLAGCLELLQWQLSESQIVHIWSKNDYICRYWNPLIWGKLTIPFCCVTRRRKNQQNRCCPYIIDKYCKLASNLSLSQL